MLVAVCLAGIEYLGSANRAPAETVQALSRLARTLAQSPGWAGLGQWLTPLGDERLVRLGWWSGACLLFYGLAPAAFVKLGLRRPLGEFGLSPAGLRRHLPLYAGLYLVVLPFVVGASFLPEFQRTYPFYRGAGLSWLHLATWELLYAVQFFTLEFFFRGFLVQGLRPRLQWMAVPVMLVPYTMIHFGKPLAEVLGAVVAGGVLGSLAWYTRSIWLGFLLHVSVALTMDLLALAQSGKLAELLSGR